MDTPNDTVAELPDRTHAVSRVAETRPMYWSIRRELWENRAVVFAPLIVTAVVLFASLINASYAVPRTLRNDTLSAARHRAAIVKPFQMAPAPIMFCTFLVGMYYCLDALYGERRDRSILFWKSLPISDRTAVLSKAAVPFVFLPLFAYVLSIGTQLSLMAATALSLIGRGVDPTPVFTEFHFIPGLAIMIYGLAVHTLWFAPIYGWFMLVSAWARRAPFLWAIMPVFVIGAAERALFDTSRFMKYLGYRLTGAMKLAFTHRTDGNYTRLWELTPAEFLSTPGVWLGLAVAALLLSAVVRIRRSRAPL